MAQYRTCNLSATSRPSSPLRHVFKVPPESCYDNTYVQEIGVRFYCGACTSHTLWLLPLLLLLLCLFHLL
jgi:hypothetical protein